MGLTLATVAGAAIPEPVVVEVRFANLITVTENNALQFGVLDEAITSAETVVISPAEPTSVTDGGGNVLGGTQAAAKLTVTASVGVALSILVGNISANTGYTLETFMCNYDGGTDTACESAYFPTAATTATLFVGATLRGDDAAVPGVSNGSFDVTVIYQ